MFVLAAVSFLRRRAETFMATHVTTILTVWTTNVRGYQRGGIK